MDEYTSADVIRRVHEGSLQVEPLVRQVVAWCLARAAMPRFQVTTSWTGNYDTVVRANSRSADVLEAIERIALGEVTSVELDQDQPTQLRLVAV